MSAPRMLIIDTYYQPVINALTEAYKPYGELMNYSLGLRQALDLQFGTGDFYSHYLNLFGWDTRDVIANFVELQKLWAIENQGGLGTTDYAILYDQIEAFKPDVIFLQNLSVLGHMLPDLASKYFIAGQASCAIRREPLQYLKVLFTSFPHYVQKYKSQPYCKVVFNPLAFDPRVLIGIDQTRPRDIDISFVGGVGNPSHWVNGLNLLTIFAREFPGSFKWWGYGIETVQDTMLKAAYQGPAWGRDMYRIYSRSKIVINRHGEIAQNYSNNMRMYEATGCGACLITEHSRNLGDLFNITTEDDVVYYRDTPGAVRSVAGLLKHEEIRQEIAARGQARTLNEHNYYERMKTVSDTIMEML